MISALNAELPDDMIIDGSVLDISTIIGPGVCINSIDYHKVLAMPNLHIQESLELSTEVY